MAITIEHIGGIGIHAKYDIKQDGKKIAQLTRNSFRGGWRIESVYYGFTIATVGKDISDAKDDALNITYPSEQEIYDTICRTVESQRRNCKEKAHAHDYARLARELVAGSNSARAEIEELVTKVETFALDRSQPEGGYGWVMGRWGRNDAPSYPLPPGKSDG